MVVRRGWLRCGVASEPGSSFGVVDGPSFREVLVAADEGGREAATCRRTVDELDNG